MKRIMKLLLCVAAFPLPLTVGAFLLGHFYPSIEDVKSAFDFAAVTFGVLSAIILTCLCLMSLGDAMLEG